MMPRRCLTAKSWQLAVAIIDQLAARHFKPELDTSAFSENNLTHIQDNLAKSATEQGYALRLEGADLDRHQCDVIFSSKNHGLFNGLKAAQGTSAWSPSMMVAVMTATRAMSQHFASNCESHVVFDLEKPTQVFLHEVEELMEDTDGYCDVITGQEDFDANQDNWTQAVERRCWERLQVPEKWLDLYFSQPQAPEGCQ